MFHWSLCLLLPLKLAVARTLSICRVYGSFPVFFALFRVAGEIFSSMAAVAVSRLYGTFCSLRSCVAWCSKESCSVFMGLWVISRCLHHQAITSESQMPTQSRKLWRIGTWVSAWRHLWWLDRLGVAFAIPRGLMLNARGIREISHLSIDPVLAKFHLLERLGYKATFFVVMSLPSSDS